MVSVRLHRLALFSSFCTLILLCAGALVTGTGSGLAVPDWPLSYGQFFPPMVGGVLFEHGHRLVAGFVAALTVIQAVIFWKWETRKAIRILALVEVGIVLLQASLGGLTVLLRLPKSVSIAHACLAQIFFTLTVVLVTATSRSWKEGDLSTSKILTGNLRWLGAFVSALFFCQLLLGATLRHFGAGLSIPDFPLSFGQWIPPHFEFPVLIHFAHRVGAFTLGIVVTAFVALVHKHYWNRTSLVFTSGLLAAAVILQVMMGAMIIWLQRPVPVTTLHLAIGALCLSLCVSLTVQLFRLEKTNEKSPALGVGIENGWASV